MPYDALVLTGGAARRLDGAAKPALIVGGRSLLERVAGAVVTASRLIVVGPPYGLAVATVVTREEPPGGGPVAAIAAGLPHVCAPEVAVLAADLPFLTAGAVGALRAALGAHAGAAAAVAVDAGGREQRLCAVWRTPALRAALGSLGDPAGLAVTQVFAAAGPVVRLRNLGPGDGPPPPWFDCDTPEDLAEARQAANEDA